MTHVESYRLLDRATRDRGVPEQLQFEEAQQEPPVQPNHDTVDDPARHSARTPDQAAQSNGFSRNGGPTIEPWIGADDLALALDVSTDWVYEKAASGELPSYKFGGHRRFRVSEVEDWASKCVSGKIVRGASDERRGR